eukprot:748712-Hanusia_phi.AAC.4
MREGEGGQGGRVRGWERGRMLIGLERREERRNRGKVENERRGGEGRVGEKKHRRARKEDCEEPDGMGINWEFARLMKESGFRLGRRDRRKGYALVREELSPIKEDAEGWKMIEGGRKRGREGGEECLEREIEIEGRGRRQGGGKENKGEAR